MASLRSIGTAVVLCGVFWQWRLRDALFLTVGVGRVIQPIKDFPYDCRRITHEQLEGCEDLWLDEKERVLYGACSGSKARSQWNPT